MTFLSMVIVLRTAWRIYQWYFRDARIKTRLLIGRNVILWSKKELCWDTKSLQQGWKLTKLKYL